MLRKETIQVWENPSEWVATTRLLVWKRIEPSGALYGYIRSGYGPVIFSLEDDSVAHTFRSFGHMYNDGWRL